MEAPDKRTGSRVIRPDVAGRSPAVDHPIADCASYNDKVLVHDGGRIKFEVTSVNWPKEVLAEVHNTRVPEGFDDIAGRGIEAEETVPTRQENAEFIPVLPGGDTAVPEAAAKRWHPVLVGPGIEDPANRAGLGVKRGHAVVVGADIDGAINHDRRAGETAWHGSVFWASPVLGSPGPHRFELGNVVRCDLVC